MPSLVGSEMCIRDRYQEILADILSREEIRIEFPNLTHPVAELVEMRSYQTLNRIKEILENDELDDPDCFRKIEEIVCAFEHIGSGGGNRHDFG